MKVTLERTSEPWWWKPMVWLSRGDWPALFILAFGYRLVIGK